MISFQTYRLTFKSCIKSFSLFIFFFFIFSISGTIVFAQDVSLGFHGIIGVAGADVAAGQGGIETGFRIPVADKLRLDIAGGLQISDFYFNTVINYKQSYYLGYIEAALLYFPYENEIRPYAGAGTGYYVPHNTTPGMNAPSQGYSVQTKDLEDGPGYFLLAGIEVGSSVIFDMQFKYLILPSKLDADMISYLESSDLYYRGYKANLNMLSLRAGIRFRL